MKRYLLLISPFISFGCFSANDDAINQLPSDCSNFNELANKPYKILPCFSATLGNNRTNQSAIRDAYRQFHALNWPTVDGKVGLADFTLDYTSMPDTLPVWQSWPTIQEIESNLHNAWSETHTVVPESCRVLAAKSPASVKQVTNLKSPLVLTQFRNPQDDIISDRNGNITFYSVHVNKPAFDYIQSIRNSPIERFEFPTGSEYENMQRGAVFVKAAWRKIDNSEFDQYHKAYAYIVQPNENGVDECTASVVGLSAMHITSKNNPKNINPSEQVSTTNKWSWATYIQENSVPKFSRNASNGLTLTEKDLINANGNEWAYFSLSIDDVDKLCKNNDFTSATCPINQPVCSHPADGCKPTELVALPVVQDQQNLSTYNNETKQRLNTSVWSKYEIINNQWSDSGIPSPTELANPILEPFEKPSSSCSSCHSEANTNIYKDYIFNSGIKADTIKNMN
ncbi:MULTISPECIES: hypothetical protein [Pseudoalteromonas]|uniref:Cytochrome c family protein n=1 Tax=Pseudoalteromonas amylolytica TaxID=1859457 RepID=A0A1S1MP87_9GAMM|nr:MULTISPECIES: hypothetical protein [Pseudoalteromonas]OHU84320.1 hypothetical protein BFC16_01390 [Pseudoalteromonas sp. JW3]OHU87141.1 hypothetical protein BET10_00550 [Pseudoalteromonas amylolytica]